MRKPSVPSVIFIYTDSAAAVGPPVGLAQARPSYHYTDSAAAVGPPVGLAQARPNNAAAYYSDTRKALIWRAGASLPSRTTGAIFRYIYIYIYGRALHIPYISKCFYVNFFKRNHRVQRSTSISSLAPARQQCPAFA